MPPLVSIIIPTYNRATEVCDAVRSALMQTHPNLEVIVVNDGSTDHTSTALSALSAEVGEALVILAQANAGASAARNTGLSAARGSYVQFLDSDDVLAPEKLAVQVAALEAAPERDVALCYGRLEEGEGSIRIGACLGERPRSYLEVLCSRTVHVVQTAAPLWRRDFLLAGRQWNPTISLGDDLEFHTRCLADARRVAFVPRELFTVRHHQGERLSDYATDNSRLASLLATREAMFENLTARGLWTPACSDNTMGFMRSLYVNYLRRMTGEEVERLERAIIRMARPSQKSFVMGVMIAARRVLGRRALLTLVEKVISRDNTGARSGRRIHADVPLFPYRRIKAGLTRRAAGIARLRVSHAVSGIRSLRKLRRDPPKSRTVLLVEPNEFHTETLPGYIALIAAANFRCVLLVRSRTDVTGALSRLSSRQWPKVFVMNLWAMSYFLRSRMAERYDLVFFNSGTIAELYGYFGSILDYVGHFPSTRLGYLMVEHSHSTLRSRGDWPRLDPNRLFALSPVEKPDMTLRMLAPVQFGTVRRSSLDEEIVFVTVGRVSPAYRNFEALASAIEMLQGEAGKPFKVIAIGAGSPYAALSRRVRSVFQFVGFQPFAAMYDLVEAAHFFLPLLDSEIEEHRVYMSGNTTGSRQLILGFEKVAIWERPFAECYGFNDDNAIIYEPGCVADGIRAALALTQDQYNAMSEATARKKRDVFEASLANFKAFLQEHGDADGAG